MEQFKAYEAQIDSVMASECFQKLSLADVRTSYFLQKGRGSGIVLKSDMKIELGGCQATFSIIVPSDIKDSGVFLCGEDLNTTELSLPFGQIVKVAGHNFDEETYYLLGQALHGLMQVDGYMVKKSNQTFWCRISNQAAKDGLSFAALGEILIQRIKKRFANITNVQVFYLTSPTAQFQHWQSIAGKIYEFQKKIKESVWKNRGINVNECIKTGHCGKCSSKELCATARENGLEVANKLKPLYAK
ncbi:hypothetical protein [Sporomusa acidovorans]|uniref:CO-methylating acetyl-CoA synthase n=1 Tax=Sporomusa acidovorans (strain ATCC 49682 / DSM 3132 / Mol) TaxID=1123286 RepID=A0ABZ3J0N2_SPOA4|nr:hypothetical protein [Sporomusa acidovorans]OZC21388.1 carbon monoxide dehydrogenase/acetyl-CoA synthase subunit alpha [Sporomusa acidovorans DSM 3132]SDE55616.1 CO dehydrogenase/acetyl-CoA synthase complex beta subunit [Sporomusa acidovorans]